MVLIHWLQRLADAVPPAELSLLALTLTAVATTLIAHRRLPAAATAHLPELTYLVAAPLSLILLRHGPIWLFVPLAGSALAALAIAVARSPGLASDPEAPPPSSLATVGVLAGAAVLAAVLLGADLGGYLGRVMIWEHDTAWRFVQEIEAGRGIVRALADRLQWNLGLVSTGDDALLYGMGVRLAWSWLPISVTSLRLPAALLALACLPAAWLAARCAAGRTAATWATVAIAVAPPLLYYGRYGSSLSGSLLAVLLALAACCALVCPDRIGWWRGLVAGGALFIATLGYAPARLTVVGMLASVCLITVAQSWKDPRRLAGALALAVVVGAVCLGQLRLGRTSMFVDVRGEQIFRMTAQSGWLQDYLELELSPDQLDWSDRVAVAGRLLEDTIPQLGQTLGGTLAKDPVTDDILRTDPPRLPLYQPWALVFGAWGLAISCRRVTRPPHLLLLAAFGASIVPVLFTTRVDAHRLLMVVAPTVIWVGMGAAAALAAARSLGAPRILLQACGGAILILAAADSARLLYDPEPSVFSTAESVLAGTERARGPVLVVAQLDFKDLGVVVLEAAERRRRDPAGAPRVLDRDRSFSLSDAAGPTGDDLPVLVSAARRGAAMLIPADRYGQLAELARTRGLAVERRGSRELGFWWVTSPD